MMNIEQRILDLILRGPTQPPRRGGVKLCVFRFVYIEDEKHHAQYADTKTIAVAVNGERAKTCAS